MKESLKILVVDDDVRMAKTLVDIFHIKGFQADAVNSGADALKRMEKSRFDFVLTDIKMPEMNGVELIRAIRKQYTDMAIIMMTAYSSDSLVKEGLKEGAMTVFQKPLNIKAIIELFSEGTVSSLHSADWGFQNAE